MCVIIYKIEFTVKGQVLSLNLRANGILKGPSGSERSALKLVPESATTTATTRERVLTGFTVREYTRRDLDQAGWLVG